MDHIVIRELRARCIIGVDADERRNPQEVIIDVVLGHDATAAGRSDRLADAVDYRDITSKVLHMVEGSRFRLVEALAQRIADICLDNGAVMQAEITVRKPAALAAVREVGIRITRARAGSPAP